MSNLILTSSWIFCHVNLQSRYFGKALFPLPLFWGREGLIKTGLLNNISVEVYTWSIVFLNSQALPTVCLSFYVVCPITIKSNQPFSPRRLPKCVQIHSCSGRRADVLLSVGTAITVLGWKEKYLSSLYTCQAFFWLSSWLYHWQIATCLTCFWGNQPVDREWLWITLLRKRGDPTIMLFTCPLGRDSKICKDLQTIHNNFLLHVSCCICNLILLCQAVMLIAASKCLIVGVIWNGQCILYRWK